MNQQGKFDEKSQLGFIKLLGKQGTGHEKDLGEEQWADWIQLLRELVASSDEVISADALVTLTALYNNYPERMGTPTTDGIEELQLGRLLTANSA